MAQAAFILLRILAALASLGALAATILMILASVFTGLLKDGGHVFMTLARFFASGLRDPGPMPPDPTPLPLPLFGLAGVFLLMFCSVFTPGQKIFLHLTAATAFVAAAWRIGAMLVARDGDPLYLPVIALWLVYYVLCLRNAWPR
jgi:hypothetical protein